MPFGVDPKTVLCLFYKSGHCEKGTKCKFSHDMNVGRKVEKKNLYEDTREEKMAGESGSLFASGSNHRITLLIIDTMETWDEEKLRDVVMSKHGNPRTTTDVRFLPSRAHQHKPDTPFSDRLQTFYRSHRKPKVSS